MLQLWLFTSTLEGLVAGKTAMALPALLASAVILAVNVWMLWGVNRLEEMD
jgi:hypothetical protein